MTGIPRKVAWAVFCFCYSCGDWGGTQQPSERTQPQAVIGEQVNDSPSSSPGDSRPIRLEIPAVGEFESRWLWVEQIQEGAEGAWARGSFDRNRNALVIKTRDVRQFAIDTALAGVNWQKPVVLSIDGSVSELRRRPQAVIHLRRSPKSEWAVTEP